MMFIFGFSMKHPWSLQADYKKYYVMGYILFFSAFHAQKVWHSTFYRTNTHLMKFSLNVIGVP